MSSSNSNAIEYDLHLSAISISSGTVQAIESIGFVRDEFANNTKCVASEYHGTFRGSAPLPDDHLWATICSVLSSDTAFSGGLEEEVTQPHHEHRLIGSADAIPEALPPIELQPITAGKRKACDLHISISLATSARHAIEYIETLQAASFEKPSPEGVRRIYTVTCETFEDGENLFLALCNMLDQVPGLHGKLKLEGTTRFFRHPIDAATLPLTDSQSVRRWLNTVSRQPVVNERAASKRHF
jgi:hypothetical protein